LLMNCLANQTTSENKNLATVCNITVSANNDQRKGYFITKFRKAQKGSGDKLKQETLR
jgi:hypothetical protein